jgi:hypothetical protein
MAGMQAARDSKLPSERDWERSAVLEPLPAPRDPELIGDGGGLPFSPAALAGPAKPLDAEDPAVAALLAYLVSRSAPKRSSRTPWKRTAASSPTPPPSLDGWRQLARSDDEVLFGLGRPPKLLTMAFRQTGIRRSWTYVGATSARPLRVTREGIRASSWRLDPTHEPQPEDTVLRALVTEQSFAGGQRAFGRVLTPDIYIDQHELVLTMFVTPRPGYQSASPNRETPVRIALPEPLGTRRLIDGAVAQLSLSDPSPPAASEDS